MGSLTPQPSSLPDKSSPALILTYATETERRRTWSLTYPKWGPALSREDYLNREAYMTTVPLAKDGGIRHWILTLSGESDDDRPVLSSCESLRKRAIAACSDGTVVDGLVYGIGSVFTDPAFRGRGYADRMMREVGARLRQQHEGTPALFSVLYSDIGRTFYAKRGWSVFPSVHVALPPVPGAACGLAPQDGYRGGAARVIGYHELAELCWVDERLLREEVSRRARETRRTCVAILPDLDQLLWHLMREDYMTKHIFGRTPAVKGAVFGGAGRRIWAVWTRGYYGGVETVEGNTLHVLRVVIEDGAQTDTYLTEGLRAILQVAQAEAAEWRSQEVQMWNPTPRIKRAVEGSRLEYQFVERESESIASLMWYGEGRTEDVDWIANEKYGWC